MILDYLFLTWKNIRKRGLRSWLTMLGIFIGIAAVVSLISLGQGLQTAVTGQFATLDADKLIVENAGTGFGPPGSTVVRKLTEHDVEVIEDVQGVDVVIPRLIRIVSVEFNNQRNFEYIASVPENDERREIVKDALNVDLENGKFLEERDSGRVVLGNDFTSDGFGKEIRIGSNLEIQGESFEVVGILEKGASFQVNSVILMLETDMEELLDVEEEYDIIVVQVLDEDEIVEVAERIERELRKDRDLDLGEEDFSVQTPLESVEAIDTILNMINLTIAGIAALSLLVGGIGIANTMYTSVLERTKEIGVMKAIGARNKDILILFLIESALLGFFGGLIGALLGFAFALGVSAAVGSFLGGLELGVNFSIPLVVGATSFSLLIGVISGIVPALQASRLNPVEALRR